MNYVKPIAINGNGMEILYVAYDIADRVYWRFAYEGDSAKVHKSTIRSTIGGRPYFIYSGKRYHLNEFIRVNRR